MDRVVIYAIVGLWDCDGVYCYCGVEVLRGRLDFVCFHGVQFHGDYADDILCCGVWDADIDHKGARCRGVRQVHFGEIEVVNEFRRLGGGDRLRANGL